MHSAPSEFELIDAQLRASRPWALLRVENMECDGAPASPATLGKPRGIWLQKKTLSNDDDKSTNIKDWWILK